MHAKSLPQERKLPAQMTRLVLGMLLLLLTLLLIITASFPIFSSLLIDETCEAAANGSFEEFSAETAVPDCWLTP